MLSILKLRRTTIVLDGKITISKGLFCKSVYTVGDAENTVVVIEANPFLKPLGIYNFKIYSEVGKDMHPEESIPLREKDAKLIMEIFGNKGYTMQSTKKDCILMAIALSSSFAGMIVAAPIVRVVAVALGKGVKQVVPSLKKGLQDGIDSNIYKYGSYLSLALVLGYVISFAVILLRNSGFKAVFSKKRVLLESGVLPHRRVMLSRSTITAVRYVTAPIMWLFGRCTVKFSACGYGKSSGELGFLIPAVRKKHNIGLVGPKSGSLGRCCYVPLTAIFITMVVFLKVIKKFEEAFKLIVLLFLLVLAVEIYIVFLRIYTIFHGGVKIENEKMTVVANQRLKFTEIEFSCSRLMSVEIKRTLFDVLPKTCTVKFSLNNKNRDSIKIKYMPYDRLRDIIEKIKPTADFNK